MSRKHHIRFSDPIRNEHLEEITRKLPRFSGEVSEFHRFEASVPFTVEPEANTDEVLHHMHANPEVFQELEAMYGTRYDHEFTDLPAKPVFELNWSDESEAA